MADNTTLKIPPSATNGDLVRTLDDGTGLKYPVGVTAFATTLAPNVLTVVTPATPLPVTAADLPLPTGAATSALQGTGNTALSAIQTAVELLDNAIAGNEMQVDVLTMPTVAVTGTFFQATQPVSLASVPSHPVTNTGTFAVQVDACALPTGAATSARQDTGNTSLASIDTKTPALGQALAAASVPVVLTAAQLAALTPLSTVAVTDGGGSLTVDGTFWQATQPVSIAATVTVTGAGGTFPITDSGGSITVDAPVATPVFVRLSDGAAAITTLPVSLASVPTHAVTVASGGIASGAVASGAFASGAVASGAFASGSIAAGAVAAGPTSFVKLEDVASADADAGVPSLAVRKATPANTSGTDGDYEFLQMSAGRLWTSATIDAALPAGTNAIGKLAANSGVDIGDVDVTSVVPGTAATSLGKAIDAAAGSTDTGVAALAIRDDALTTLTPVDGDYATTRVDSVGALWVREKAGSSVSCTNVSGTAGNATTIAAANPSRTGLKIYNASGGIVYMKFGATPTATSCTLPIADGGFYEMLLREYDGIVTGHWAATGDIRVTEIS